MVILPLVVLLQLPTLTQEPQNPIPIEVRLTTVSNDAIELSLRNTGRRPITAWAIVTTATFSDATTLSQVRRTDLFRLSGWSDLTEMRASTSGQSYPLSPGMSITVTFGVPSKSNGKTAPEQVRAEAVAAIFDDGSTVGNSQQIRKMMDFRRGYIGEYRRLASLLNESLSAESGSEASADTLRRLRETLENTGAHAGEVSRAAERGQLSARSSLMKKIDQTIDRVKSEPQTARELTTQLRQAVDDNVTAYGHVRGLVGSGQEQ